jgi:hypothetical protein
MQITHEHMRLAIPFTCLANLLVLDLEFFTKDFFVFLKLGNLLLEKL